MHHTTQGGNAGKKVQCGACICIYMQSFLTFDLVCVWFVLKLSCSRKETKVHCGVAYCVNLSCDVEHVLDFVIFSQTGFEMYSKLFFFWWMKF